MTAYGIMPCNYCILHITPFCDSSNRVITRSVLFEHRLRPWPNDSIFHSRFSSTFDLKVERLLSVVEHMWPNGSIFRSTFLSTFQLLIFPQRMSAKTSTIINICQLNETLLRMFSLDLLDKLAKRLDFHSTTILLLDFFDKDQTSLNISRLHSTHSTRWLNGSIFC